MAFDLASAKPVVEDAPQNTGFDLSSARPVDSGTKKVYIPEKGKTLEVPEFFHSGLVGQAVRENFFPELTTFTGETFKSVVRGFMNSAEQTGSLIKFFGETAEDEPGFSASGIVGKSSEFVTGKSDAVKRVGESVTRYGDRVIDNFDRLQKSFKVGGFEIASANPDIWSGTFMKNPSWTRATGLVAQAIPSLATATALTFATRNPFAGASALGLLEGSSQREEARDAGKSIKQANAIFAISSIANTLLEEIPLGRFLNNKNTVAGNILEGFLSEGIQESLQEVTSNLIAKIGYDKTRDLMQGVIESFIAGAGSGGAIGAFTANGAEKVDVALNEAISKGVTPQEIENVQELVKDHILENSESVNSVIESKIEEVSNAITAESISQTSTPETASVAIPQYLVSEETSMPDQVSVSKEDISLKIEAEAQAIIKKIESFKKQGEKVPASLTKRLEVLSYQRTNLDEIAKDVLNYVRFDGKEEIKANKDLKKVIREKTTQTQQEPKKYTEMQALKGSLRAQARTAIETERSTKSGLKDLKTGLVLTIKDALPQASQGKFLSMIANAQDGRDIVKVVGRIEKVADEVQKRALVSGIKKEFKRIKASKSISIDYVGKIKNLLEKFELQGHRKETLESLKDTQDFLDEKRQSGEDVSLPQYVLNKLKVLTRNPLKDIDVSTLKSVYSEINRLADLGKTKLKAMKAVYEAKKESALNDLLIDSKPVNSKDIIRPEIGKELSQEEVGKNRLAKVINTAQAIDLSITPMDVIFDVLDGNKGYTGANYNIFKKTIDVAFSEYLRKKFDIQEDIVDLANKLEMKESDFEKIGFYAAKNQEGGIKKLESLGFSEKEIDSVKLDEKQEKLYSAMRRKLDDMRPEIAEVMRTVYNEELGTVKNYFPFMTDFESMSDFEIRERFGNNVQQFGDAPRKNVEKGFTLKRVGGKQKIKLNAMEIFLRHVDNATYLTTVGRETKWLGEIAKTEEYKSAVGDKGQEMVVDWVDTVARKGKMAGERVEFLDVLRKNVGLATLGFKLSSVLIQPTSLMDGAALVGGEVFEGAKNIATDKAWREFVLNNMPEVKARVGDDPAYMDFGGNTVIDKAGKVAFWALQQMDGITASSVATGAYIKFMRSKGLEIDLENPNSDAVEYAQRMVRRTQASAFFKDAPQAISRGKLTGNRSLDRLLLQFQTFMLNRWSFIKHDGYAIGIKGDNKAQALNIMAYMVLASIAETGFRGLSKELIDLITPGEDDDKESDGITKQVVMNLLGNVPFVSQFMGAISYGSIPVPSIQFARKAFDRLQAFSRSKSPEAKTKNLARALTLLSGLAGVPGTVQADSIIGDIGKSRKSDSGSSPF